MPELFEFATAHGVKAAELVRISESMATDRNSAVFKAVVQRFASKWTEMRKAVETGSSKRKNRVYVPYPVPAERKYELNSEFPMFDIRYSQPQRVSAGVARAVSLVVSEYMLTLPHCGGKRAVLYGFQLRPLLMRNRSWAHLCLSGNVPHVQSDYKAEDAQVAIIYDSMVMQKRRPPPVMHDYVQANSDCYCTDARKCEVRARTGLMVLDRIDTNYRQLALFMDQHRMDLLYFQIPGNKAMEFGVEGRFEELDAYVAIVDGKIKLVYKDDVDFQQTYSQSNYLELVARTTLHAFGYTYTKEFVTRKMGYLIYKITRVQGKFETDIAPYKSWFQPKYRDLYLLKVPVLKQWGNANNPSDYKIQSYEVNRSDIDKIFDAAVMANVDRPDALIAGRVVSAAHNFITHGQITRQTNPMTIDTFVACVQSIYVESFSAKFNSGAAVAAVAPAARFAGRSAKLGLVESVSAAASIYLGGVSNALSPIAGALRVYQDKLSSRADIPLPGFSDHPGFVEYGEGPNCNPAYTGWERMIPTPGTGFSTMLMTAGFLAVEDPNCDIPLSVIDQPVKQSLKEWTAGVGNKAWNSWSQVTSGWSTAMAVAYGGGVGDSDTDVEVYSEDEVDEPLDKRTVAHADVVLPGQAKMQLGYNTFVKDGDPEDHSEMAEVLVRRVMKEHDAGGMEKIPYAFNAFLLPQVNIQITPGSVSQDPISDLTQAIWKLYPNSMIADNSFIEAEKFYGVMETLVRTVRMKVDASRFDALKPETFLTMAISGHLLPDVKETPVNVIQTLAKRNADTPYNMEQVSESEIWERSWRDYLKVYYVDGAEQWLTKSSPIVLDETALREWLHRQDPKKLARLHAFDDYTWLDVSKSTKLMQLMLKKRLKPELDAGYETTIKMPQTVQHDETGRSVMLLSPVIRTKVKKEQFLLKPNVLVMQMKSRDDIVRFLNQFSWLPDENGEDLWYVEIDQSLFDKSQVRELKDRYKRILLKHGVLEEYVEFIDNCMFKRTVWSPAGGVAMDLDEQNPSGAAFTLDRNNETSKIALASLIEKLGNKVVFVMIMGDDVTVAVRGRPDVSGWEAHLNKFSNLRSKVNVRAHGYFCSMEIVHLPDGSFDVVRDPLKALVMCMEKVKTREKMHEKWISFCDSFKTVGNLETQLYLIDALSKRWALTLPGADQEAVHLVLKAMHSFVQNEAHFMTLLAGAERTIHF